MTIAVAQPGVSNAARYTATTTSAGDSSLVYVRSLEVRAPEIPAEHYGEYRQFFKDIVQADRAQAVLVHKQQ